MSENIKPATYSIRRNYLKQFFAWCVHEEYMTRNPPDGPKKRRDEGRVVHIEVEALTALLTLPDKTTFAGLRDYALMLLTLDTGIRPKEAFALQTTDINDMPMLSLQEDIR